MYKVEIWFGDDFLRCSGDPDMVLKTAEPINDATLEKFTKLQHERCASARIRSSRGHHSCLIANKYRVRDAKLDMMDQLNSRTGFLEACASLHDIGRHDLADSMLNLAGMAWHRVTYKDRLKVAIALGRAEAEAKNDTKDQ